MAAVLLAVLLRPLSTLNFELPFFSLLRCVVIPRRYFWSLLPFLPPSNMTTPFLSFPARGILHWVRQFMNLFPLFFGSNSVPKFSHNIYFFSYFSPPVSEDPESLPPLPTGDNRSFDAYLGFHPRSTSALSSFPLCHYLACNCDFPCFLT